MKVRDKQKNMKTTYKYMLKQRQYFSYPQIAKRFRYYRELSFEAPSYFNFHLKKHLSKQRK